MVKPIRMLYFIGFSFFRMHFCSISLLTLELMSYYLVTGIYLETLRKFEIIQVFELLQKLVIEIALR